MGETALSVLSPVQEYGPTPMTERAMRISSLLQEPCTAILSQQSCLSISANNPATTKPDVSMAERQPQKRQRGPVQQRDLGEGCGLRVILDLIRSQDLPVPVIEFTVGDIVRSGACAMWVRAFEAAGL
jgi:hypothetical protein